MGMKLPEFSVDHRRREALLTLNLPDASKNANVVVLGHGVGIFGTLDDGAEIGGKLQGYPGGDVGDGAGYASPRTTERGLPNDDGDDGGRNGVGGGGNWWHGVRSTTEMLRKKRDAERTAGNMIATSYRKIPTYPVLDPEVISRSTMMPAVGPLWNMSGKVPRVKVAVPPRSRDAAVHGAAGVKSTSIDRTAAGKRTDVVCSGRWVAVELTVQLRLAYAKGVADTTHGGEHGGVGAGLSETAATGSSVVAVMIGDRATTVAQNQSPMISEAEREEQVRPVIFFFSFKALPFPRRCVRG